MSVAEWLPVQSREPQQLQHYGPHPPPNNPFFYGWREVSQCKHGTKEVEWIPLTLDDVLHPQSGDHVMQNREHFLVCKDLFNGLEHHLRDEPLTVLLHDVLLDWERDDVQPMSPDIAVVREVTQDFPKGEFFLKQSHGHVDLVLEVTSPSTWQVDVDGAYERNKVQRYAKAGVPYYIIVMDHNRTPGQTPQIIVYRLNDEQEYEPIAPDPRGWYWIPPVQLWIGPYRDWVAWYDEDRNKIGTYIEEADERKRAEDKARLAEDKARYEADERKRAEDKARLAEDKARLAEDKARLAEDKARLAEDKARLAEDKARLAEDKARYEADERKRAEDRIRELEALLQRTRENP